MLVISEHAESQRFHVTECVVLRPFVIGRPEESLGDNVVITLAHAAHQAFDARVFNICW